MRYRILTNICLTLGLVGLLTAYAATSNQPKIEWHLSQYWPHSPDTNLWNELANHFTLDHYVDKPQVQHQINFLRRRQDYINELTNNAKPYLYFVYSQTQTHNMPVEIALVPMIESDYDPFGVSSTGATGLWQMMPGTASGLGLKIDWWHDGRRDVVASTNAALEHLRYLHSYFGNWLLALAAYNCGDGTVRAAIRYNKRHHLPADFWHLRLPVQTKLYVPKLLALAAVVADRNHYNLHLAEIPNHPYFAGVKMEGQLELSRVAKLSNTSKKAIRKLNPTFRRWATIPIGKYWLLIPADKLRTFEKNLRGAEHKTTSVAWEHHRVSAGDTLGKLASENHTTVTILKNVNHLKSGVIRISQELLIPNSDHETTRALKKQSARIAEDKIPGPKRSVHNVKAHESLWAIAANYKVKPSQIRYWNHIGYHDKLKPNQKLVIWKKHARVDTGYHMVTVEKDDSLSRIGDHYQTTPTAIMRLNNLRTSVLQIGQKLKVAYPNIAKKTYSNPPNSIKNKLITHTVRPGQSLGVIAHYYHVSTHQIVAWNHLQDQKYLHVSEKLKIYIN